VGIFPGGDERYHKAERKAKQGMLNEFCLNTGYHRKYAIRLLTGATAAGTPTALWPASALGAGGDLGSCGISLVGATEGLAAALDALDSQALPDDRSGGEAASEHQRSANGPALADPEERAERRIYGRTKPGSLLKHPIPVKTDSWDVTAPGFSEIDLVAHCGNSEDGEFAHTLNLTSGWTESRALLGKRQVAVQQALDEIEGVLPFRLLGVDSDNGSEFINWLRSHANFFHQLPRGRYRFIHQRSS
jgi:hypothetical protein